MMCDELDIAYDRTSLIMGSTDVTVDQGGSGGSDAIQTDGWPMRRVAAEARRVLLELASARFGVPVDQLAVSAGVVTLKADPSRKATYGELIGGRRFNVTLRGDNINATTGVATVKAVQDLKIVGQSLQRYDIPPKVDGSLKWAVDVKLPGMLHARNVKPPVAGAKLIGIDESSVRGLPGFVKVVSKGNYVAVVCEREEQAIKASRQLKVNWQKPATPPFPTSDGLFAYMRGATPTSSSKPSVVGNPDGALAGAAKIIEAEYDVPFQGHTAIGPAHATADPSNGQMTIYSNDMKSYGLRNGVAEFLQMPRDQVRVVWMEGPQGYGRTAADDAGFEAAFLAKEIGRPVRVQWMRNEETAWDTKGPAFTFKMRGALDAQRQPRRIGLQRAGRRLPSPRIQRARHRADRSAHGHEARHAGRRQRGHAFGHVRDPEPAHGDAGGEPAAGVGIAASHRKSARSQRSTVTFAAESFIDELAAAAKADPVEFRLKLLTASTADDNGFKRARSIAVRQGGGGGVRLGHPSLPQTARHRNGPHRARHRLHVPEPDRGRGNRGGRGQSPNRSRVGEAAGVRARLRAGHQPRRTAARHRGRHAPLAEPHAPRGSDSSTPKRSPAWTGALIPP